MSGTCCARSEHATSESRNTIENRRRMLPSSKHHIGRLRRHHSGDCILVQFTTTTIAINKIFRANTLTVRAFSSRISDVSRCKLGGVSDDSSVPDTRNALIRFGIFEVMPATGELRKSGARVKVQDQPFKVLLVLLEHAGDLVTREELKDAIAPGSAYGDFDHIINVAVTKLRSALGDSSESPRYIETIPKRGYRFVAPVERVHEKSCGSESEVSKANRTTPRIRGSKRFIIAITSALIVAVAVGAWWRHSTSSKTHNPAEIRSAPKIMLAVLPFDNFSKDSGLDYVSDGITDAVITELGRLEPRQFGIVARTSMIQYKATRKTVAQVAKELGAGYVLEGGIQQEGKRLRITAQLIRATDETQIWAERYDRNVTDLLTVEAEIAQAIARVLQVGYLEGPATRHRLTDPVAYDNYLKGRYFQRTGTADGLGTAVEYFRKAINQDRYFAPAYSGLADTYITGADLIISQREGYRKAEELLIKSLTLDEGQADTYSSLGRLRFYQWRWAEAEHAYKQALRIDPSNAIAHYRYGTYLKYAGQTAEAIEHLRTARKLEPLIPQVATMLGSALCDADRFEDALAEINKALESSPESGGLHYARAQVYQRSGMLQKALEELKLSMVEPLESDEAKSELARTYALLGDQAAASELLRQMEKAYYKHPDSEQSYFLAVVHASLGDNESAIVALTRSVDGHSQLAVSMFTDPAFVSLRSDTRFQALLRRVGFRQ